MHEPLWGGSDFVLSTDLRHLVLVCVGCLNRIRLRVPDGMYSPDQQAVSAASCFLATGLLLHSRHGCGPP